GLRLDPLVGIEDAYRPVEYPQAAFHLDGEVDMAGSVDDVEPLVAPERGRRGRSDRDAALLLLLHPIHGRGAFVHLAHLVPLAGVIENPLSRSRLAGIDVGHDAEIAVILYRVAAWHGVSLQSSLLAVTSGNARTPGWLPPFGACLRVS